jgi:hypothetical protein
MEDEERVYINFLHLQHKEVDIEACTILPAYEVINVHPGSASGLP